MSLLSGAFGRPKDHWIEADDLAKALSADPPPVVVDVRNPDEFAGPLGHIEGAANIPLPAFAGHVAELARQARPVVLVCHTDKRSSAAADQLRQAGASDVRVLHGGMVAWRAG